MKLTKLFEMLQTQSERILTDDRWQSLINFIAGVEMACPEALPDFSRWVGRKLGHPGTGIIWYVQIYQSLGGTLDHFPRMFSVDEDELNGQLTARTFDFIQEYLQERVAKGDVLPEIGRHGTS